MSASGGMSQLLKGIIIGVVLIMAIIGTMSLLDSDNLLSSFIQNKNKPSVKQTGNDINAPSITLNPDSSKKSSKDNDISNIGDLNAEIIDEKDVSIVDTISEAKPVLEDERTAKEALAKDEEPIKFGIMKLRATNPANNQPLKASYSVFDKNNVKVAASKDATDTTYRLPSGQYKVETTLMRTDQATNQNIPVVTKSRYVIVRENSTTSQAFELEPPASTGVLQVSAKVNDQVVRANFVIQKENGEIIASRNNVTNSLFKLNTGSYKVSVTKDNNKDFRSVEIKAGESTQTIFDLKETKTQGKLLVRIFDTRSSNPVRADIKISSTNGTLIQDLKATTQTELTLAAGNYKISVVGPNGTSNKNISIRPGQSINEIFRFETSNQSTASTNENDSNSTQINENVTIKPIDTQTTSPANSINIETNESILSIVARDNSTKKPIKSNIYIQTLAGKHLNKKTYVDSARFNLEPGVYKVTVRSKNRNNNVKTIRVSKNQKINETFLMVNPNNQSIQTNKAAIKPAPPIDNQPKTIPTGFLNISMQSPNNQQTGNTDLRSHFIVSTLTGQKIVELTSVRVGNFKLDVGSYEVTAIHKNKRKKRRINIRQNQNTRLIFNTSDFLAVKGVLRSQIVNEAGRPLKGNLIVSNLAGQVVARANNVSSAVFNLPPVRHSVSVNYQGLSGSEVISISPNETTVQTFTIAPNNNTRQNNNVQQKNNSRDIKEILREKIKKEIRRTF